MICISMAKIIKKNLNTSPDETRTFEKGKVEVQIFADADRKSRVEPGWSSEVAKPIAKTNSCQAPHTRICQTGRMKVVMDNDTKIGPGDVKSSQVTMHLNPDAEGIEKCVAIDSRR